MRNYKHMKKLPVIFIFLLLILGVIGLFFLINKPIKNAKRTTEESMIMETTEGFTYADKPESHDIKILKYTNSIGKDRKLYFSLDINKDYLLNYNVSNLTVCLVALDSNNKIINAVRKDEGDCYYSFSGSNYPLAIATIPIDSTDISIDIPADIDSEFVTKPASYFIEFVAMDNRSQENSHEWSGMVGFAVSGKINIK